MADGDHLTSTSGEGKSPHASPVPHSGGAAHPGGEGRRETPDETLDRNWNELLQELRVTQTGVQILTAFLLTMPFQGRFEILDGFERRLYLVLVLLAVLTTALIVAPVSLHRLVFRRHLKRELVSSADRLARAGLLFLAVTISGAAMLVFDVVVSRVAGVVAGAGSLALLTVFWLVVPLRVRTKGTDDG